VGVTLSIHDCKELKAKGSQGWRRPTSINQMSEDGGGDDAFNSWLQRIKSERIVRPAKANHHQPNEQRRGWRFKSFGIVWYEHQSTLSFTPQTRKLEKMGYKENGMQQPINRISTTKFSTILIA
jgi:hypothetical protein